MKNLNLKTKAKNMKGITLVALVISIIVLLILATVSINLVINNGILDKAKTAVEKYSDGEIEEQIKLTYQEYQMSRFTQGNLDAVEFMTNKLEEIFVGASIEITPNSEQESFPMLIKINNKDYLLQGDGTSRKKYGIDEYDVAKHPETYYGHYVTNYNSPNDAGITANEGKKWKIFMADDTNIYLIASNFITRKYTGTKNNVGFDYDKTNYTEATATRMGFSSIIEQYNANSTTTDIPGIISRLNKQSLYHKWMNTAINQTKNYHSEKAVATMLDVDIWSGYINTTYAKYAIGGPTLEMFCKGYNDSHTGDKLEAIDSYDYGYKIKKGTADPSNGVSGLKTGAKNTLVDNMYFKQLYWLASPYSNNRFNLLYVNSSGNVDNERV